MGKFKILYNRQADEGEETVEADRYRDAGEDWIDFTSYSDTYGEQTVLRIRANIVKRIDLLKD